MSLEQLDCDRFDIKLANECAKSFYTATGLACTVSGVAGNTLLCYGAACDQCTFCRKEGVEPLNCEQAHLYGMGEAERFGGRYIYFCPAGLTYFVSPILNKFGSVAKITVGPFRMVDEEDFKSFELEQRLGLSGSVLDTMLQELTQIPYVEPSRVNALSVLLFMSVGFMNDVWAASQQLEVQQTDQIQGLLNDFIYHIKTNAPQQTYPTDIEHQLLQSIAQCQRAAAGEYLNEILGHIFFLSGNDFERIKSRVYELLVLVSRAAVDGGADAESIFGLNHRYLREIQSIKTMDHLCKWLTVVINRFMDLTFHFDGIKHGNIIYKAAQYVRENYEKKISLEDVSRVAYLSPSYFSKVFKQEMGCNFNIYLNKIRIEKSKKLLLDAQIRLVDISTLVGFEDQSYFTKVFKKIVGVSPSQFRAAKGHIKQQSTN